MGIFDQAYDKMSWAEVCTRIPGNLAVKAIQRRITNLDTLKLFFENSASFKAIQQVPELKKSVNEIISNETIDSVLSAFDTETDFPILFGWLNDENKKRISVEAGNNLTDVKLLFNLLDAEDTVGLNRVLDLILGEQEVRQSHIRAVLSKANKKPFVKLLNRVLSDSRPEVRVCVLGNFGATKQQEITAHQMIIGLKALARATKLPLGINVLDFKLFANLRPTERLDALEKYLDYFPKNSDFCPFKPEPDEDEINTILFAGCMSEYERMSKLIEDYGLIRKAD